jgi:hypothetical protein
MKPWTSTYVVVSFWTVIVNFVKLKVERRANSTCAQRLPTSASRPSNGEDTLTHILQIWPFSDKKTNNNILCSTLPSTSELNACRLHLSCHDLNYGTLGLATRCSHLPYRAFLLWVVPSSSGSYLPPLGRTFLLWVVPSSSGSYLPPLHRAFRHDFKLPGDRTFPSVRCSWITPFLLECACLLNLIA